MNTTTKFIILSLVTVVTLIVDILLGSVIIPLDALWSSLTTDTETIYREIIINYRIPKAITACFIGAALSSAGLLMQTLFKNPLAGPDILGVNSGAGLGIAIITLGGVGFSSILAGYTQIFAAILGASFILGLVILVSTKIKSAVSLLIVGVMFGYFTNSIVSILQSISDPDSLKLFITWTFGSLSAVNWSHLAILAPTLTIALLGSLLLIKQLNTFLLGSEYAQGLGIDTKKTRFYIILLTAILTGTATAFTGPIGFIGITVPHIARGFFNTSNHRVILPGAILLGASILLICDVTSQLPGLNMSLPINSITSLFGAPVILWIMLKRR